MKCFLCKPLHEMFLRKRLHNIQIKEFAMFGLTLKLLAEINKIYFLIITAQH